jgi:DMSO reductase family type II enzyme chaperone
VNDLSTAINYERECNQSLRKSEKTAESRSNLYTYFSLLLGSPHEVALESKIIFNDTLIKGLPYSFEIGDLIEQYNGIEAVDLKRQYSALFEVGDEGPPAPIREDLFLLQPAKLREDLVRFYDYFGYTLNDEFQWQMDHLSIELEFMHFLSFQELESNDNKLSFQLGQLDFSKKHLLNWVPDLSSTVNRLDNGDIYSKIVVELNNFLSIDNNWQKETINNIHITGG